MIPTITAAVAASGRPASPISPAASDTKKARLVVIRLARPNVGKGRSTAQRDPAIIAIARKHTNTLTGYQTLTTTSTGAGL
jgi:hypothetical protein